MKKSYSSIVIGNGIMAKQLMFELQKKDSDILNIFSEDFAPSCSKRSTAINCLRGTEAKVSELGDLIFDGFRSFEHFVIDHGPDGVSESLEVQTWKEDSKNHAKWLRRYKDYDLVDELPFSKSKLLNKLCNVNVKAYLISTEIFYSWYEKNTSKDTLKDFIVSIEKIPTGYKVLTKNEREFFCKKLFICAGFLSKKFSHLCKDPSDKAKLDKQKNVIGNYLEYKLKKNETCGFDLNKSFSFSYEFIRLVYRKESHDFVMSFSDKNKDSFLLNKNLLKEDYQNFCKILNLKHLPQIEAWELKQGIRCKGHQRIPFAKKVDENLFILSGLYKNAFSFAYTLSKKIKI